MKNVPAVGALLLVVSLSACRITPALSSLPSDLPAGTEEWAVTGHSLRYAGAPVTFGPYYTPVVKGSGLASRWTLSGRHVGFGRESRNFGFQLERDRTPVLGAGCGSRLDFIRLQRGGTSVEIGDMRDVPALACDIWPASAAAGAMPAGALTLWYKGADIIGTLDAPGGRIDIVSTRGIEGVPMAMGAPVAYRFMSEGRLLAHVDVLNAGAVRMVAGTSDAERDWIAAAATALLMRVD